MIQRLLNILKSLKTDKRIEDENISVTVDDTKDGKHAEFDPERVKALLKKCGLSEESNQE